MTLDARDRRIVAELTANGRLSNVQLAERTGMSPSNSLRHVKALEEDGTIAGYTAIVDAKRLGYGVAAFIMINLDQRSEAAAQSFFEAISKEPRIVECFAITGSHDVIAKVVAESIEALGSLTMDYLLKLPSVLSLTSCVVMKPLKQGPAYRL